MKNMNLLQFAKLGVSEENKPGLNDKIVLSNQIAVFISIAVALPFVGISLLHFPPLTLIPILGTISCLLTLVLNYLRLHNLSRIVIGAIPALLATLYGSYVSHAGQMTNTAIALIALAFTAVPFMVFEIKESGYLLGMSIYCLLLLLGMDALNDFFEINLDTEIIEFGYLAKVSSFVALSIVAGAITIMARQSYQTEQRNAKLLIQAELSNREMADKETALKENLKKLSLAQEEDQRRQWANEGLNKVAKIIREAKGQSELFDKIISFIVKYVNANQGGVFILNDVDKDEQFLELRAAYAFERKKYIQKRIQIGEGLVGQIFLEKEHMLIKKVPTNYVAITSGLGGSTPNTLLILPIKTEGNVLGVLELASFNEFAPHQISFLDSMCEILASSIKAFKISETTEKLLVELQTKTEEMRAQEEEMKQNLEELQAMQEEMQRKEQNYLKQIKEQENQINFYKAELGVIA